MRPALRFGPGDPAGFTSTGLTGFQDLRPEAVVRELVQNAMDAAGEAEEKTARVRFRLHSLKTDAIPGIKKYRAAFEQAVRSQKKLRGQGGDLPSQTEAVVRAIKECLGKEECGVMSVSDNGIGLDERRMVALLGDGMSVKANEAQATGAFGNGHFVAIPASDLRYVLYGGVVEGGHKIGSGHAILASHQGDDDKQRLSKDGYFVKELRDDLYDPYVFAANGEIPSLIKTELERIHEEWSHGSAVVIPAFNHFREPLKEKRELWDSVSSAAATNFFAAIAAKRLVVSYEDEQDSPSEVLDHESLAAVLEKRKQKKRGNSFLSGSRAHEAFQTLKKGRRIECSTQAGPVRLLLRCPADGGPRIDLCRNGMWITNKLPRFQNQFSGRQTFHCLILLDADCELHDLVRGAEGPLHNSLPLKYLEPAKRKKLQDVFVEIRERLKKEVPRLEEERFRPDDIFVVGAHGVHRGGMRPAFAGTATPVRRPRPSQYGTGDHPRKKEGERRETAPDDTARKRRGAGKPLAFQALPVPTAPRSCRVEIIPSEDCTDSEFRIALDENVDVTCDGAGREPYMALSNARLDGAAVLEERLMYDDNRRVLGLRLGKLTAGRRYVVEADYEVLADVPVPDDQPVVLQIEVLRHGRPAGDAEAPEPG